MPIDYRKTLTEVKQENATLLRESAQIMDNIRPSERTDEQSKTVHDSQVLRQEVWSEYQEKV